NGDTAYRFSRAAAFGICAAKYPYEDPADRIEWPLDEFLTGGPQTTGRTTAISTAAGLANVGPVTALPALIEASEPCPCRLTTPDLVEPLKMPTCFGKARQVVLKHLGNRYRRHFANHWEFVRFATEQHLELDFTTRPKRPARP